MQSIMGDVTKSTEVIQCYFAGIYCLLSIYEGP